jgi:glycosyltransferase involved in cell wall biosynthesis
MKPEVTVITPTFNHSNYIEKCLESVANQTYKNWEQIVVDDASTDDTFKIITSYIKGKKNIKIIRHHKRWGVKKLTNSYNQALELAKGDYVAILEGDDFWPKDKLQIQLTNIKKNNSVLSYGDCVFTNALGSPIKIYTYKNRKHYLKNSPPGIILKLFSELNFSVIPVTVVLNKKALLDIGGFQKDKIYPFTDVPTILALSLKGKFDYINKILGFYRKQGQSSWFSYAKKTQSMGKLELQKCVNNFIKKNHKSLIFNKLSHQENEISITQSDIINKKKRLRPLSKLFNFLAFNSKVNLFFPIFALEYFIYNLKKESK